MTNKFTLAAIFALTIIVNVFAQKEISKQRTVKPNLLSVKEIFEITNFDKTTWSLYGQYDNKEYAPTKAEEVITDVDKYLALKPTINERQGQIKEFELIKKYRNNLDSTFQGLGLLGSDQIGKFLYSKNISLPIHFALYGDTALSLIISGAFIDNVYNTLKLSGRQRATKVITTYILPSLKSFAKSFKGKEIRYFGMTCVYGSKDFADNGALATKPEFVAFIAPVRIIKQYVSGDLTEDDLINAADIFVCDRDMVAEIKKIKITLE